MQLATIEGLKMETRISASGSKLGQRMAFNGKGTPSQMREEYKKAGMKGAALSKAVRDAVKGGKSIAWVSFHALTQMAQNGDYVPTIGDINAKGTKVKLTLEKPTEAKVRAKASTAWADRENEVEKLKAELEALKAEFAKTVEAAVEAGA